MSVVSVRQVAQRIEHELRARRMLRHNQLLQRAGRVEDGVMQPDAVLWSGKRFAEPVQRASSKTDPKP